MGSTLNFDAASVHQAIDKGEFFLLYQPRLDIYRQKVKSVEALVRWQYPEYGIISPDKFIPPLEHNQSIVELGRWIIEESCRQAAIWHAQGYQINVSINISPVQCTVDLKTDLLHTLKKNRLTPQLIELEVTESLFLSTDVIQVLSELMKEGFAVAIDDFGTGYSALSTLRKFNASTVKIDKSFFEEIPANLDACLLLRSMIRLGHSLGMKVVCEGVETQNQLESAQLFQADEVQGFYFSKPVLPEKIIHLINHGHDIAA